MATAPLIYHPRMAARLYVPAVGTSADRANQQTTDQVFKLDARPVKARWVSNNYNEADELELHLTYDEAGLDPRYLRSAEVYFWLADGDPTGDFRPTFEQMRFVGIVRDVERSFTEDHGKFVRVMALDYTTLFLEAKNYPPSGVPKYSDTLTTAWQRVCDHTGYWDLSVGQLVSTVQVLRDRIEFQGVDGATAIGKSVPARIAKLGQVQVPGGPAADAWAVWRTVCESLGLITFIRGDRCIVTTATDYYTADDPPRFVYGENVQELVENRELGQLSSKNVCCRAYNPVGVGGAVALEGFYPPPTSNLAVRKKRLGASATKAPKTVHTQDYELFDLPFPVADQATLDAIALRIWEERTRQELHGHIRTRDMQVDTSNGETFDLLKLQAGDQIEIRIRREALDSIQALPSIDLRQSALLARGYSTDMAKFVATNLDSINRLPAQFMVHSVETECESPAGDGAPSYQVTIHFLNRVDLSGSGSVPTQTQQAPPIAGQNLPPLQDQNAP